MDLWNIEITHLKFNIHFILYKKKDNNKHSICTLTSNMYQMTRKLDLKNTRMTKKMYGTRQFFMQPRLQSK